MRRVKLTIEYDGTNYVGWQKQPNGISVQEKLETALFNLTRKNISTTASGRTDAGVHALKQIVHFDCETDLKEYKIIRGINFYLPEDIRVINAETVNSDFHARYDAKKRTYKYYISLQPSAVLRKYRWTVIDKLAIDEMQKAARFLIGKKDFKSFCSNKSNMDHYICDVFLVELHLNGNENELMFEIQGSRFLHNMVRAIVGTLVEIGRGKIKADDINDIIAAEDRKKAGPTAPPEGLFLVNVEY